MKKILSLVLVLVLALGSFSFATPSDVVGTDSATAVDRLMSLNLLTGYPDGTFKPAATITRAEFAAVVVRSLGLETAAIKGATKFADVPATHWASGYISVASGLGIINGYTTGNFGPSDAVTYEQAVAMVVRALGYEPAVAAKGGYPAGYLIVASENDLLDGITGTVGSPAPRGLVAMLVDNALETPMMVQVGYGDEVKYEVPKGADEVTLLENKLGLTKATKTIASVDVDDREIKFNADSTKYEVAAGVALTTGLEYLEVTYWEKSDVVYALQIESTVYFDFIKDTTTTELKLDNAGVTIDLPANVVYEDSVLDAAPAADEYNGMYGKVIVNDDDEVTRAELYTIASAPNGIVSEATATKVKYDTVAAAAARTIADIDDMDFEFIVIDGKAATVADLKAGMFIQYIEDTANFDNIIVANTNKVEGILNSVATSAATIKIAGTVYDLGTAYYSLDKFDSVDVLDADAVINDELDDLDGKTVVAYKNNKGDIVLVVGDVEETTSTFYGFLKTQNTFSEQIKVNKIVDGDVETVTYAYDVATADGAGYLDDGYNTGNPTTAQFFKFTIDEDNVIIKVQTVTDITSVATASAVTITEVNGTNDTMKTTEFFYVTDSLVVFTLLNNEIDVTTWADLVSADITNVAALIQGTDNTPGVILITNDPASQLDDSDADYILAYAAEAGSLAAGKYTATVKTNAGDLAVIVDDSDAQVWTADYSMLVLQLKSNGEYDVIEKATPSFVTGSALAAFGTFTGNNFDVVSNGEVKDVDGQIVTIGAVEYRVAADAMIYRQHDVDDLRATDLGAILYSTTDSESDNATVVIEDGMIKLLIFKR